MIKNPPTSHQPPPASPDALIDALFVRLATMFGNKWLDMWANIPIHTVKTEWARTLTGITPTQFQLAIDDLITAGTTFPPTLPEFAASCRSFRINLPAPQLVPKPDSEQTKATVRNLLAWRPIPHPNPKDPLNCFRNVIHLHAAGNYTSALGIRHAREALKINPKLTPQAALDTLLAMDSPK